MRDDPLGLFALARDDLDEYPDELTLPNRLVAPDESFEIGGVRLEMLDLGPAESESATVYHQPDTGALFTGDLVKRPGHTRVARR